MASMNDFHVFTATKPGAPVQCIGHFAGSDGKRRTLLPLVFTGATEAIVRAKAEEWLHGEMEKLAAQKRAAAERAAKRARRVA